MIVSEIYNGSGLGNQIWNIVAPRCIAEHRGFRWGVRRDTSNSGQGSSKIPSVGLKTFRLSKNIGLKGIVLKNKQHIFLEKKACINFANKNKIFILVK